MITYNRVLKEIRTHARESGLTFKRSNVRLNGTYLWKFCDRKTGETVMSNCLLYSSYEDCMSGFISTYDTESRMFRGLEL